MEDYTHSSSSSSSSSSNPKYRPYNPYQDLPDISNLPYRSIYNLPTSPELLFHEEAANQGRSFTSNLTCYAGVGYLSGAFLGATRGTFQGLGAAERGDSLKIRVSRVLNSGGHTGRKFGNTLGSLGLIYAGMESLCANVRDTEDTWNSIFGGLGTGAFYRIASGPRSAIVAGAVGGLVACAANVGKHVFKRYVPV